MPGRIEKTVFISYRRTNLPWALAIYKDLRDRGYDVFFDFQSINSGDFEQVILGNIRARAHFLVLLTPTALERCNKPGDWLRREIETALEQKRNIVPLFLEGFSFNNPSHSQNLTGKLAELKKYNGLNIPNDYFYESLERLHQRFLNVSLDAVLHPVSRDVQKIVREQQNAADQEDLVNIPILQTPQPPLSKDLYSETKDVSKSSRSYTKTAPSMSAAILISGLVVLGCFFAVGLFALRNVFNNFFGSTPTQTSPSISQTTDPPTKPNATQPFIASTDTPFSTQPPINPLPSATLTEQPIVTNGQIAFVSDRYGNNEIYVMNSDGSGQTNLTNHPWQDWNPAWSPDGKQIAFVSDRDGDEEIYIMNTDGSAQINLTHTESKDRSPVWSPDGNKIAFISDRDDPDAGKFEIYVMNSDGLQQTRLTRNLHYVDIVLNNISWSSDSSMITFFSDREVPYDIFAVKADGSGNGYQLTNNQYRNQSPDWNPKGGQIAFVISSAENADIWIMNSDGSGLIQLTNGGDNLNPSWSPDGKQIAFISNQNGSEDIYVMNSDGSDQKLLTYSVLNFAFDWSPTSQQLVFATRKDDPIGGTSDIYIMDVDGTRQTRLTTAETNDWDPVWRP